MMTPADLTTAFGRPGVTFVAGNGGLTKVRVDTSRCTGEMYLHGAHVTHFQPRGQSDVLWMSEQSVFADGKAIRGGVPICFPWFGPLASDPNAPGHGWARTRPWSIASVDGDGDSDGDSDGTGDVTVTLRVAIDDFDLSYAVTFGKTLTMAITVSLASDAATRVTFEEALHTYFAVSDVRAIEIDGLQTARYIDKVDSATEKDASGATIRFDGECDRVYLDTDATCVLHDGGRGRKITVAKTRSVNTVVWNPWIDKSKRMVDFGDDEWPGMVCIETANVGRTAITLLPGQSHTMTATIATSSI